MNHLTLINVDYSLSPASKFPVAIQEVLDAYLFFTSGHEDVEKILGFKPKRIVVGGDSAGGHLVISLSYLLNDINKISDPIVQMPTGILALYALVNTKFELNPSRTITLLDNIASVSLLNEMLLNYFPKPNQDLVTVKKDTTSKNKPKRMIFSSEFINCSVNLV